MRPEHPLPAASSHAPSQRRACALHACKAGHLTRTCRSFVPSGPSQSSPPLYTAAAALAAALHPRPPLSCPPATPGTRRTGASKLCRVDAGRRTPCVSHSMPSSTDQCMAQDTWMCCIQSDVWIVPQTCKRDDPGCLCPGSTPFTCLLGALRANQILMTSLHILHLWPQGRS